MANCLSPIVLKNPYNDKHYINVPCGRCVNCISRKVREWVFRLNYELRKCDYAYWVTLTYDDLYLKSNINEKSDYQKFFKQLRKKVTIYDDDKKIKGYKASFKYYLVAEYGAKFNRKHAHMCLFVYNSQLQSYEILDLLEKTWFYGDIVVGQVTPQSINYTISYTYVKYDTGETKETAPFALISKGLGRGYEKNLNKDDTFIVDVGGSKLGIPRYYSETLGWTNEEKERKLERYDYISEYRKQCLEKGKQWNYKDEIDYRKRETDRVNKIQKKRKLHLE